MITRRAFVGTLAVGLAIMPFAAEAQQPAMPVVGWLVRIAPQEVVRTLAPALVEVALED